MQSAHFIHGNRLELLADRLIEDLRSRGSVDPMQPHVVVVAHPALGRWLQERIAANSGISMNIRFPLPSSFAWNILRSLAGNLHEESAFSRDALVWRIHAALPRLAANEGFEPVQRYLGTSTAQRQRYDLAVALARSFDEYIMARPRWIRSWKRGQRLLDDPDEVWQASLWQHLVAGTNEPDRASLMAETLKKLHSDTAIPAGLESGVAIFGASHLPPLLLEFFLTLAQRLPLSFYQPNPCLDYWGDIVSEREIARRPRLWREHVRRDDGGHLEIGHPLLASWGGLGREFLKAIHEPDLVIHDDDAFAMPQQGHLLGWLQGGMLVLDPEHASVPDPEPLASVQLHGCPSRRREVEVLRDQILHMMQSLHDLKPHEIVVMSPRIEEYAPYVAAVFGDPDDALSIPYGISDVALRATHPLIDAFIRILALGESRFASSEVLGLLAEPAIARRHGMDEEAQEWLRTWIDDSRIRWGLDAGFRDAMGAGAIDVNTWRFGFDRLLLGYAMGCEEDMLGNVVPVANVEGSSAQSLGRFVAFVNSLALTRNGLATPRPAKGWKTWLGDRLEALFDTESGDMAELAAISNLREAIAGFANQADRWLGDELLDFDVVRSALEAQVAEPRASRAGRFGITFCGMVPMRNVPHRVVCLLGLDAGEFPRRQPAAGFNLVRKHPVAGDRSIREDDRFLFLESLVAARDVFYMSHVDRDVKSAGRNPPSPLVEELTGFLARSYGEKRWAEVQHRLLHAHPMHPFATQYFDASKALGGFDQRWWGAARKLAEGWMEPAPFVVASMQASERAPGNLADDSTSIEREEISIDQLIDWLRHPLRAFFRHHLPLYLHETESDEDVEAFTLDALSRYQVADRLLAATGPISGLARLQREGGFPLGAAGKLAWDALDEKLAQLKHAAHVLLKGSFTPVLAEHRELDIDSLRLGGAAEHLVAGPDGHQVLLLMRPGEIRGIDLACLALERELLGTEGANIPVFAIGLDKSRKVEAWTMAAFTDSDLWIRNLTHWRALGLQEPLPIFRKSAEAFAKAWLRDGLDKARVDANKAWSAEPFPENADPHNALFARHREDDVLGGLFETIALDLFGPLYALRQKLTVNS